MANILFIDDRPAIVESYRYEIEKDHHIVIGAHSVQEARECLAARHDIDVIILDMSIPETDGGIDDPAIGLAFLRTLRKQHDMPVIVLTAMGGDTYRNEALGIGAYDFVGKGEEFGTLRARINHAAAEGMQSLENQCLSVGIFPGQSTIFQRYIRQLYTLAKWDVPIIIYGESGSGKELAARGIHRMSPRSTHPFIPVNCAAISEGVAESEFFGHEKGSFTGASVSRNGLFERANKGTLFLDEISELPLGIQADLLRVIQTGKFMRVGGTSEIVVNVRILAASNRHLGELIGEGKFREDLFYRVDALQIEVPSLRQRKEDIFPLAKHLIEVKNWKQPFHHWKHLGENCRAALEAYDFPNNVRELEILIQRLFILSESQDIKPFEVEEQVERLRREVVRPSPHDSVELSRNEDFIKGLMNFEEFKEELVVCRELQTYLRHVYEEAGRNWETAAKLCGSTDDTLRKYRKLLANKGIAV